MDIFILVFTQLFSKVAGLDAKQTCTTKEINPTLPLKVIKGHAFWDHSKADVI